MTRPQPNELLRDWRDSNNADPLPSRSRRLDVVLGVAAVAMVVLVTWMSFGGVR